MRSVKKRVMGSALAACLRSLVRTDSVAMTSSSPGSPPPVHVAREEESLAISAGDDLFTRYHFPGGMKPYLYPLIGPGGAAMTRKWPLEQGENEEQDHPHQRSLWFGHGDVNGHDFWSLGRGERIEHESFHCVLNDAGRAIVGSRNNWLAPDGNIVCAEDRLMRFFATELGRWIEFEITLRSTADDLEFGDTKEGTFGLRLAPTLRLRGRVAAGRSLSSTGAKGRKCWGKRAAWMDYWGPVDGETVGVAIFDHPANHAHPTWWHARDYGLFAANPFGAHDFEGQSPGAGKLLVPAGKALTFRYRVLLHRGRAHAGALDAAFTDYASQPLRRDPPGPDGK